MTLPLREGWGQGPAIKEKNLFFRRPLSSKGGGKKHEH